MHVDFLVWIEHAGEGLDDKERCRDEAVLANVFLNAEVIAWEAIFGDHEESVTAEIDPAAGTVHVKHEESAIHRLTSDLVGRKSLLTAYILHVQRELKVLAIIYPN